MKILLVYCNSCHEIAVPIGVSQLCSALLIAEHEVELFHTTFYKQGEKSSEEIRAESLQFKNPGKIFYEPTDLIDDFIQKVIKFHPKVIGFSTLEPTFNLFIKLVSSIKDIIEKWDIKIAVGGAYARLIPEKFRDLVFVDIIATSESENTFPELCNKIEKNENYSETPGYWIKNPMSRDGWLINPAVGLVDINTLPILNPTIFGEKFMMKPMMGELRRTVSVEISRGCPYKCTYCADPIMTQQAAKIGKYLRYKSVEKLEEEYSFLISQYNPSFIYKLSENFLATSRQWLSDYSDVYKKYNIPFWIESRPETIDDYKVKIVAKLGCVRFSMGLESGNERYRKTILNRGYTNEKLISAAKTLRKYGVSFSCNLIIGFPFETRDMIWDGINILRELQPDGLSVFLFTPYSGTVLRTVCVDNDMIDSDVICDDYFQDIYSLRNNGFTQAELVGLKRAIPLYVALPEKYFPHIKQTEKLTESGNEMFNKLKQEFYKIKGWN